MGVVIFYGVVIIILNFIVDLIYAWLNPRIRYDEAQ
jgi:oligopeptide transport system permease protein